VKTGTAASEHDKKEEEIVRKMFSHGGLGGGEIFILFPI
jgi:hypothetical protein